MQRSDKDKMIQRNMAANTSAVKGVATGATLLQQDIEANSAIMPSHANHGSSIGKGNILAMLTSMSF